MQTKLKTNKKSTTDSLNKSDQIKSNYNKKLAVSSNLAHKCRIKGKYIDVSKNWVEKIRNMEEIWWWV